MNERKPDKQELNVPNISNQKNYSEQTFDSIRHINEYGQEFWYARELQQALGYNEWRNFLKVLQRAQDSCKTSTGADLEHFVEVNKSLPMPKGGARIIEDYIRFTDKQKNAPVLPTQRQEP